MKFLLDSCVWGLAVQELTDAGHDAIWAGSWQRDPGDAEILQRALKSKRVLVTLDKDFGELAILRKQGHCGIVRLVNFSARSQAKALLLIANNYKVELENGAIITAEPGRIRVRIPS